MLPPPKACVRDQQTLSFFGSSNEALDGLRMAFQALPNARL